MRKSVLYVFFGLLMGFGIYSFQLKSGNCDSLVLNIDEGTLNGVSPTTSMDSIKMLFPCFTGESEEGSPFNYGGGVFFINHDFYFYTHRDYLEVRSDFRKYTTQYNLLTLTEAEVTSKFGKPDSIVRENIYLYTMKWGVMRINFIEQSVTEIGIHYKKMEELILD